MPMPIRGDRSLVVLDVTQRLSAQMMLLLQEPIQEQVSELEAPDEVGVPGIPGVPLKSVTVWLRLDSISQRAETIVVETTTEVQ